MTTTTTTTTTTTNIKTKTLKVNVHQSNVDKAIDAFNYAQFPFIKPSTTNTYTIGCCRSCNDWSRDIDTGYYTFSVTVPDKTTHLHISKLFQNFGFGRLVPKQ